MPRYAAKIGEVWLRSDQPITERDKEAAARELPYVVCGFVGDDGEGTIDALPLANPRPLK